MSYKAKYSHISFAEIVKDSSNSEVVILNFREADKNNLPDDQNIHKFFNDCIIKGVDPRTPEQRQKFNNRFLRKIKKRYLIGRYLEDRKSMLVDSTMYLQNRTIHLGIDIFSKNLEKIYAPYNGRVVFRGKEKGPKSFGYFLVIEHEILGETLYSFYGHLARHTSKKRYVEKGELIGLFGDYNENGGWSRHLHFQLCTHKPNPKQLIGYCSRKDLKKLKKEYPDPNIFLRMKAG